MSYESERFVPLTRDSKTRIPQQSEIRSAFVVGATWGFCEHSIMGMLGQVWRKPCYCHSDDQDKVPIAHLAIGFDVVREFSVNTAPEKIMFEILNTGELGWHNFNDSFWTSVNHISIFPISSQAVDAKSLFITCMQVMSRGYKYASSLYWSIGFRSFRSCPCCFCCDTTIRDVGIEGNCVVLTLYLLARTNKSYVPIHSGDELLSALGSSTTQKIETFNPEDALLILSNSLSPYISTNHPPIQSTRAIQRL
jgi:hypothetical protein